MEGNASFTNRLTLVEQPVSRRSVARTCGSFALGWLKAMAESYIQSSAYNPYWIGAVPLPKARRNEGKQG
jgi:hypothetical protein